MANIFILNEYDRYESNSKAFMGDSYAFENLLNWLPSDTEDLLQNVRDENAARGLGYSRSAENKINFGGWAGLVQLAGTTQKNGKNISFKYDVAVLPRQLKGKRVDLVRMYLECLGDPTVAKHLGEPAVFIWHDQEPIECPEEFKDDALIFLVLSYLQELHQLCLRHLRNQFIRTSENLTGRVKGRIDIAKQVRVNLPRGRSDRTMCDFTIHSNNCRENQILKTALERSARLLTKYGAEMQPVWSKVHFCRNELGDVEEVEVTPRLFHGIRYAGLFHPYKKTHGLAKFILNALPPDPHSYHSSKPAKIPPFAICTYELFERYCEVQLRKLNYSEQSDPRLWIGYQDMKIGKDKNGGLRPDFLLCSAANSGHRWIIDAKNKPDWISNVDNPRSSEWDSDVPQLCRYSRFTHVLDELGYEEHSTAAPKILVLYPGDESARTPQLNTDFFENQREKPCVADIQNLFAISIDVPTR